MSNRPAKPKVGDKLTPKMQLAQMQRTMTVMRGALESATSTIQALAKELNDLKQVTRAHILHVRELHNNPLFLQALVQKFDELAAEGEQRAKLKAEGKWVDTQYIAHDSMDTIPEGRLVLRIVVATRPNGEEIEYYPRVEQQNNDGRWFEALPFIRELHGMTEQKALSYLPAMEEGTEVFIEIVPGYFKAEDEDFILEETTYSLGGDDGQHYRVVLSTQPLSNQPDFLDLSFTMNRDGEFLKVTSYDLATEGTGVPGEVVTHFAQHAAHHFQAQTQVSVGFYKTDDEVADELLTGTPVEAANDTEPAEEEAALLDAGNNQEITGLFGSSIQPALLDINGQQVQLGTVVCRAFDDSGLTHDEWNNLSQNVREAHIQKALDVLRGESLDTATTAKVEDDGVNMSV